MGLGGLVLGFRGACFHLTQGAAKKSLANAAKMNSRHFNVVFCALSFLVFVLAFFLLITSHCRSSLFPSHSAGLRDLYTNSLNDSEDYLKASFNTGRNILAIYTGRWKFIRIQLPYVYRELRSNGGVLDEVWFMLIRFDDTTISKVREFAQVANRILGKQVFSIHEESYKKGDYTYPYYEFFSHLTRFPYDRFFKFDDDIVYVQPRAFNHVLQKKDSSKCFMHFFNIAGSNWRCSWLHQKNGVYKETNPRKLKFDYHPNGNCGWKSPECGELAIRTFLHHYKKNQLGIYTFNNLELTSDRKRFSINAFLLDKDLVDIKNMLRVGSIYGDDEKWWTMTLSGRVAHPNCIVGDALVVHFAYSTVVGKLLELGLLDEFVNIIKDNKTSFQVEDKLWKIFEFELPSI